MGPGEKLKRWRKARNLSQQALGDLLRVSDATICLWEKEQKEPSPEYRDALQRVTAGEVGSDEWLSEERRKRLAELAELKPYESPTESGTGEPTEDVA